MKSDIHCEVDADNSGFCNPQAGALIGPRISRRAFVQLMMTSLPPAHLCRLCRTRIEEGIRRGQESFLQSTVPKSTLKSYVIPFRASSESCPTWEQLEQPSTRAAPSTAASKAAFSTLHWALMMHGTLGQLIRAAQRYPEAPVPVTERSTQDLMTAAVAFTIQLAAETGHASLRLRVIERELLAIVQSADR